jgi:hypothetical protein
MRSIWLPLVLAAALLAACQAQNSSAKTARSPDGTVSSDFFDDPRLDKGLVDISGAAKERCKSPPSDALDPCVIDRVAAVLPYADKMTPLCNDVVETIDRYFCVVMGALGADLVEKSGAQSADDFLKEHGKEGERVINQAGATVLRFLSAKCSNAPDCGAREAASRLESSAGDITACATLGNDWGAVTCLLTGRAVHQLNQAQSRI